MGSPVQALLEVSNIKRLGNLTEFGLVDGETLRLTLSVFRKAVISAAVLRVIDMDTQEPIRFSSDDGAEVMYDIFNSMDGGRLFLYFDNFELVALIEKTVKTRFYISHKDYYTAYLATPFTSILISDRYEGLLDAISWVDQKVRKCFEVFPGLS